MKIKGNEIKREIKWEIKMEQKKGKDVHARKRGRKGEVNVKSKKEEDR